MPYRQASSGFSIILTKLPCIWPSIGLKNSLAKILTVSQFFAIFATGFIAIRIAGVLKLVDKPDLGSGAVRRMGSIPFARTKNLLQSREVDMLQE